MSERLISIVCPVFNEEATIPLFYNRLDKVLTGLRHLSEFELIFVNNGSRDGTSEVILALRRDDPHVQVLTLSRNYGYQAAVTAGLRYATGEAMVIIDVDCEDPPEMIATFVEEWRKGYDIVYGRRDKRSEFVGIHLLRKAFYRITRLIADSDIILDMAEFSLITREVRDAVLSNVSTFPFVRGEMAYVGFERKAIPYKRGRRIHGESHYNFWGMIQFALGGILSSSTFLLRLPVYLFLPLTAVNLLGLAMAWHGGGERWVHVLMVVNFLYIAFFLATVSIYLARTYKNVVQRPLYVVNWKKSAMNNRMESTEGALQWNDRGSHHG
ncbi:MAG: glycosyltransferase family 2 protein [Acidobacteria bacterium]|nr:glycosyltransferase family 2 protein [Acidobacteriota bacterium]